MVWETQVRKGEDRQSWNRTDTFFFLLSFYCLKEIASFFNIPNEVILPFRLPCHLFSLGLAVLSAQMRSSVDDQPSSSPKNPELCKMPAAIQTHTPPTCHSCTILQIPPLVEDTGHYPLPCILMWLSRNSLIVLLENSTGPNGPSALLCST